MRSTSVQPRSAAELDYRSGGDISPPVPDPHLRAQSLQRVQQQQQHPSPYQPPPGLTPVSRIQIGGSSGQPDRLLERPLDRPTLVRPNRASLQNLTDPQGVQQFYHSQSVDEYYHGTPPHQHQPPPQQHMRSRLSQPDLHHSNHNSRYAYEQQQQQQGPPQQAATPADQEKFEVIPMNADKPCGIEMNEFLPKKLQQALSVSNATENYSRFSAYKGYQQDGTLSESEVTSSILKGHESMMAVLATRGRNIEILHKLWQNKDAKTAVDQAVSLNDQAVLVDLLSVITLRPSIWNLDLCTALLPPIGELLQSKYEMYINTGCGAMKLILKNFASVIKTNIDSPIQTVGVDISREERHNKCMECYKDLVKIRSLILKRQTMQGKMGHTYRELSILMQYLD